MNKYLFLIIILLHSVCSAETVTRIVDGDTFYVDTGAKIRLYGVDCPESDQKFGAEATAFTKNLCLNKAVSLQFMYKDYYGRDICKVTLDDGSDLNGRLLEAGLAWVYDRYCLSTDCEDWNFLELLARSRRLGLWVDLNAVPPWIFRRCK